MKEDLYSKLKIAVIDGLKLIAKESNSVPNMIWAMKKHSKYPIISYFDNGLPRFYMSDYVKTDYSELLLKNKIFEDIESWVSYRDFVLGCPEMCKHYEIGEFSPEWRKENEAASKTWNGIYTHHVLAGMCDSYVHKYSLNFDEEQFSEMFEKYYNSIIQKKLSINICVPIIFGQFESEEIILSENIIIKKIDEAIQLSRNERTSFTSSAHSTVIGAATHALLLKNWTIENLSIERLENSLHDINSYKSALEIVNNVFSALRIAIPKVEIGYAQIICLPVNWQSSFNADILQTFVASERNYPQYFEDYWWLKTQLINSQLDQNIIKAFTYVSNSPYIELSCKRLNRACMNSRESDSIIDISIALESLLTNDSKSEINYKLAVRASLLNKYYPFKEYSSQQIFELCKKIYDYRSSIVHGDKKREKNARIIQLAIDEKIEINEIAQEFLKHIIWTIADQNITTPKDIDTLLFKN
jgi:hypothetical protein